ncbi:hypothetical protein LF1_30080 [Rubripirellula obstinata]|uniref:Uncharacterized protein n=1 Tax=Rubripirellula obstinata TaxID=406547 RepID=A0A5B1CGZ8_9BACT|nr:hypothetical protein LF1_30080 [Rubripirellula obstinata]
MSYCKLGVRPEGSATRCRVRDGLSIKVSRDA